jgi:uncharacterized repeat protein (TIGR03803 family)
MKDIYSIRLRIYFLLFFISIASAGNAQNIFQKMVQLSNYVAGCDIEPTSDGGYIIAGQGAVSFNYSGSSLIKIDSTGDTLWTAIYADSIYSSEECWVAKQTLDGGFITAGGYDGGIDYIYLRKTDAMGNETWKRSYDNFSMSNMAYGVEQMSDSGYAILHSWVGGYLSRTDKNGNLLWSHSYYNSSVLKTLARTTDGGFIITGWGYDTAQALMIIKTDSGGNEEWQKLYGVNTDGNYIEQTVDGGYIVAGSAPQYSTDSAHILLMKLDATGTAQWTKTIYSPNQDWGYVVHQAADGGYIIAGATTNGGNGQRLLLVKADASGNIQWKKTYGEVWAYYYFKTNLAMQIAADGGYICTSYGHIPSCCTGTYMVKTDASGNSSCNESVPVLNTMNSPLAERTVTGVGTDALDTVANIQMDMSRGAATRNICFNAQTGNHHFWVTAGQGGSLGGGTLLTSDSLGNQWERAAYFYSTIGKWPNGDIVMAGNGKIYGVCQMGGWGDSCTLYSYDTLTQQITKHHDFAQVYIDGDVPVSGLVVASDCKLYGTALYGGTDSAGVIFSFNTLTNTYTDVYDFQRTTGAMPCSELLELPGGIMYGVTERGGVNDGGVIFSFNPSTSAFAVLHYFDQATGSNPSRNTLIAAPDGYLYGAAQYGGTWGGGVIYRLDKSDSTYTVLHHMQYPDGMTPFGRLCYYNGKLYGLTLQGGAGAHGTLFSYDLTTDTLIVHVNFNGTNGAAPGRGLKLSSYGTMFGTTREGGVNDDGVIFRFDPVTDMYTKVFDFDSTTTGKFPDADVMELGTGVNPCIILDAPTQNEAAAFSLYPNPSSGSFTISTKEEIRSVEIFNAIGEKIYAREGNAKQLTIHQRFSPGIYFARVSTANGLAAAKFIVE